MKKILSWILWIVGEALLILAFLQFGHNINNNNLLLNIIISSIVYSLYFIDLLFPMVDLKDKTYKKIGSLGIKWLITFLYSIIAIGLILYFGLSNPIGLTSQIIIHAILVFILVLGLYAAFSSENKVVEIHDEQVYERGKLEQMKNSVAVIQSRLKRRKGTPSNILKILKDLQDDIRFVSPGNNLETINYETKIMTEINKISAVIYEDSIDYEIMMENIQSCIQYIKERKSIYSN